MTRDEVIAVLKNRMGEEFGIDPALIEIVWDGIQKPRIRIPSRLDTVSQFSARVGRFDSVIKELLGEELSKLIDTRDLSDGELTARLRARRHG